MKVYLDDRRMPPDDSWILVMTVENAIALLKTGEVTEISLDHDLGDLTHVPEQTGYDVLTWIERAVYDGTMMKLPFINIHTANPVAEKRMWQAVEAIEKFYHARDDE